MLTVEPIYISALSTGLLGGSHSVGKCGDIVTALMIGLSNQKLNYSQRFFSYQLSYNIVGFLLTLSMGYSLLV